MVHSCSWEPNLLVLYIYCYAKFDIYIYIDCMFNLSITLAGPLVTFVILWLLDHLLFIQEKVVGMKQPSSHLVLHIVFCLLLSMKALEHIVYSCFL